MAGIQVSPRFSIVQLHPRKWYICDYGKAVASCRTKGAALKSARKMAANAEWHCSQCGHDEYGCWCDGDWSPASTARRIRGMGAGRV